MGDTSAHTRYERVSRMFSDSLLKVLDLEDELKRIKTAQQTKIDSLKRRVKKHEKKQRSRTHKLKRFYKVSLTAREISSSDKALDTEDTSKQGRIHEIDADEDIALVSTHDDVVQDEGIEDVGEEDVVEVVTTAKMIIDAVVDVAQVTTAIADILVSVIITIVTTALTITTESTKTNVEVTRVSKTKRVMIQKQEETTIKTASSQQPQNRVGGGEYKERSGRDSSKRERDKFEQERSKKQKVEDDKEFKELKKCLEIIPGDGDDVTIDVTPLSTKYPTIVDYKITKKGKRVISKLAKVKN
nr:hypothetical protein [Tanacetum cinerariifolium]